MNRDESRDKALEFARGPKWSGGVLLALGLLVVTASVIVGDLSPVVWIAGLAMTKIGMFSLGFGLLVQVANISPRQGEGGSGRSTTRPGDEG